MKIQLSAEDARVIGALIEKEITTPDQYPLSLNALVNACNQKSNRDPLMNLDARSVQHTLDDLARRALAVDRSGFGSRVPKYRHLFCNTAFGSLRFSPAELAIVCELLLRGPQTPGELRTRASRMHPFGHVDEVQAVLDTLASREDGPFVVRLEREPGRRESRYAHLFSGPHAQAARDGAPAHQPAASGIETPAAASTAVPVAGLEARVAGLEQQLAAMRLALDALQRKLAD